MRRLASLWLCGWCLLSTAWAAQPAAAPAAPAAPPVRIAYLYSDGNIPGTLRAYQTLLAERPDLRGRVQLTLLSESVFDQVRPADVLGANVLVLDTMNEQMLAKFNSTNKTDLIQDVRRRGAVLGVGEGLLGEETYRNQGVEWDPRARAYWQHAGAQNQLSLLKLALTRAGIRGLSMPDPQLSLDFGYYYPDGQSGQVFARWEDFDAWRQAHGKRKPGAPRVAIGFFKATYYSGDTALLDTIIAEIERQGAEAIPVFGYPGAVSFDRLLRDPAGQPRADVGLGANFNFSDLDAAKLLAGVDIPVINLVTLYGRSEQDWRASPTGLSLFEGTFNLAVPELAGTVAPTVVGSKERVRDPLTGLTAVETRPIRSRVSMAVSRALRYAALRNKANADKHIALLYYNYPPGKASIGASYLNVAESIANTLRRMADDGYQIGGSPPTAEQVLADITGKARNVTSHAPGELDELLRAGDAVRMPLAEYRRWLAQYPSAFRNKVIKDWGQPEASALMTSHDGGNTSLIIPVVRYGNIALLPQPSRAWGEDLEKLYHAKDLAPHHQYVATYAWLRNGFKADAVIHLGTHGTLEWLDGKDAGLSEEDAPDALIADLPDLYIYNVDVVGEGLVARRRGMATLIDHMVPPFKKGGQTEEFAHLSELMNDHTQNESKNPELAAVYARQIRDSSRQLGIAKDLSLDPDADWNDAQLHRVEDYLLELKGQNIPYGLHAFGRTPEKPLRDSTVDAIVSADRHLLPDQKTVLAADMDARIAASGPRELGSLSRALRGGFVPAGSGGEPIRNPDSYATGNNFYGIDPDKVPKPASWELGVKLADQMLADHLKQHGRYPQKVSFVIWGDETMRHEGVLESQIFHLLGTKPVWNDRGKVVGVDVIPRSQLGRPRVDIVIASAAEGMFNNVTRLMDEAVQKVKAMDEADNLVRQHYLATKATLISRGYSEKDADQRAGVRIFDESPGTYNLNTSSIVAASGSWDSDAGFANDYISKMGHGYGNGFWGESMADVFKLALAGTEKVVHSSSTSLYGALDNDDMYMYMGGLAAAVRSIDGKTPEMLVTNTRDPGRPEMSSLDKFIGEEFRSRYVNPVWIEGMKKEGYAGAGEMRAFVEYLWGWNATAPEVVDAAMWQETFATYVQDKHQVGMKDFFESKSPFAYQDMTARMIETVRKDYWKPDQQTLTTLLKEYVDSVNRHGASCSEHTCGNARLLEYVLQQGRAAGIPTPALQGFRTAMEAMTRQNIEAAAKQLNDFVTRNEARAQREARVTAAPPSPAARTATAASAPSAPGPAKTVDPQSAVSAQTAAATALKGLLMEQEQRSNQQASAAAASTAETTPWTIAWLALPLLSLLLAWRWRHARATASPR